jgi:hypothetical protein
VKKLLVIVIAFLVIGLLAVAVPISLRYDYIQYEKDMMAHDMKLQDGGDVIATYQGQKTRVIGGNIGRLEWALTLTDRTRVFRKPVYDAETAVTIDFPDGARYVIVPDPSIKDKIYIFYSYKDKDRCYTVPAGYKAMDWIVTAISPEGVYSPNEIIG